jgi:2-polyprenyl-3-methyl-5-hydroxy-6-metoxy-1,4-benzoquinol methylase
MKRITDTYRFCGHSQSELLFNAEDYNNQRLDESFDYYRCTACGTVFIASIPANLGSYYEPSSYSAYLTVHSVGRQKRINSFEVSKLAILQRYLKNGRVLEIGPGAGAFLRLAQAHGYELAAIEQSPECAEQIERDLAIEVICTDEPWEHVACFKGKVDAIVMWHVIEHLAEAASFLDAMSQVLPSNGLFIVSAPNPKSWSFKVFKQFWVHLDAPRHLLLIPVASLDEKMRSLGFDKIHSDHGDVLGRHLCAMAWQSSFVNKYRKTGLPEIFLKLIGRGLHYLITPFELFSGQGAAYTVAYRRRL